MKYSKIYISPLGPITLVSNGDGLTGLYLREPSGDEQNFPANCPHLDKAAAWLDQYFQGHAPDPGALVLITGGSAFQQLIWKLLLTIPYGETRTYGQLAREAARILGKESMSAQAVGGAVGRNPIAIIIPCHRVVAAGGKLGGFGWGKDAKQWLLRHEGGSNDHQ